jgi:hypothetical protein
VESYIDRMYPKGSIRYPFVVSLQMLADLTTLNFAGGDTTIIHVQCMAGFSIFALAPSEDHTDPTARRDRMKAFEDTADQHRPADRDIMDSLSAAASETPRSRDRLYRWADHFGKMLGVFFGPDCGILPELERFVQLLLSPSKPAPPPRREYSRCGVPTHCGPDWSRAAVKAAGPHVSALLPKNVTLM